MPAPAPVHAPVHAEHVGSLLRPGWLLRARAEHRSGALTGAQLREAEDRAALEAIALQRDAGIEVFTDGEVRRESWMAGLMESVGGTVPVRARFPVEWRRGADGADTPPAEETSVDFVAAAGRVRRSDARTSVEAAFLAAHAPGPYKITMISSSMGALLWHPQISGGAYPAPADLVRDLVALQIEEITELADQGVGWIQLDSLGYNMVFDEEYRVSRGMGTLPGAAILDATIAADRAMVAAARRRNPGITIGMHICRGNNRSAWMSRGSYEPVAERLFGEVEVDRFLLEYDTERAGGFEPLRFIRPGTVVVLGLVSSKVAELERTDELMRRIEEAARYVPPENLALSPQCGFASTAKGNLLTIDDQRRKLELVAETARQVWG